MIAKEIEAAPTTDKKRSPALANNNQRVFDSRMLFGQEREIRITHNGESYSLRMTRLGKLLLTK